MFTFPCVVQHTDHETVAIQFTVHLSTFHILANQGSTALGTRNMVRMINIIILYILCYIIEKLLKRTKKKKDKQQQQIQNICFCYLFVLFTFLFYILL